MREVMKKLSLSMLLLLSVVLVGCGNNNNNNNEPHEGLIPPKHIEAIK